MLCNSGQDPFISFTVSMRPSFLSRGHWEAGGDRRIILLFSLLPGAWVVWVWGHMSLQPQQAITSQPWGLESPALKDSCFHQWPEDILLTPAPPRRSPATQGFHWGATSAAGPQHLRTSTLLVADWLDPACIYRGLLPAWPGTAHQLWSGQTNELLSSVGWILQGLNS